MHAWTDAGRQVGRQEADRQAGRQVGRQAGKSNRKAHAEAIYVPAAALSARAHTFGKFGMRGSCVRAYTTPGRMATTPPAGTLPCTNRPSPSEQT